MTVKKLFKTLVIFVVTLKCIFEAFSVLLVSCLSIVVTTTKFEFIIKKLIIWMFIIMIGLFWLSGNLKNCNITNKDNAFI